MPDLLKVAKFGGTSVADLRAMKRCANIVKADRDKRVLVLSATSGTTNQLIRLAATESKTEKKSIIESIEAKHIEIAGGLDEPDGCVEEIREMAAELLDTALSTEAYDTRATDRILSFGERMSTTIFTRLLNETGVPASLADSRKIIKTDSTFGDADPLPDLIKKNAAEYLAPHYKSEVMVTQGFIGSDRSGVTTTLGRGGSDYTAALLAEALDADVLEIWTDVTAIYTTDPRVVPEAAPITEISFDEAAELSVFGAKVLHPSTLKPAMRKNIRVYVGSSIHPEKPGTWIVKQPAEQPVIRAISLRPDQTLITVHSLDMLHRHGFLAKLFQILADYKISVDLVTTSEVSVSLTIDTNRKGLKQRLSPTLIRELESIADVHIEEGLTLIALVGNHLDQTPGISGALFNRIEDINIRMICHGASSHNLCFLVREEEAGKCIRNLHAHFITSKTNKTIND